MKNPFPTVLKAARMARKGRPLSAALLWQRALMPAIPKPPRAPKRKSPAKKTDRVERPAPGSFIEGDYSCAQGSLRYRLYTPVGSARRRLPLIVMLHGCTQSAADFATGTAMNRLADELGFLVLYPEQSPRANPNRCWNWHSPSHQKRGSGEAAVIASMTRHILDLCKGHEGRVYIAGISAGGAAAAIVAAAYPQLYVAVGVHSGVPMGTIGSVGEALAAMRGKAAAPVGKTRPPLPMILFHGDSDRVVHPSNAAGFVSQLQRSSARALSVQSEAGVAPGGRAFTRTLYRYGRGPIMLEEWTVHGSGHAWSGGQPGGSHTDPKGPDASRAMAIFFLARRRAG
ncbi:PHB depolymerase family esterase [Sphingobium sp.]|uniref:extracellular catalytic domain type 1 short-chain-length polyhydroxyalkanoate depolymerase n=1 Tax=Sphingobium TaxID=165695 RepID=UPI001A1FDB88|nr:PHB depolymerase family esterase [Sphingobium sp.]MBJ7375752.1 PHB depolymerase family esterase [Sphingobium sp.]